MACGVFDGRHNKPGLAVRYFVYYLDHGDVQRYFSRNVKELL
jgi:hypothetical protein